MQEFVSWPGFQCENISFNIFAFSCNVVVWLVRRIGRVFCPGSRTPTTSSCQTAVPGAIPASTIRRSSRTVASIACPSWSARVLCWSPLERWRWPLCRYIYTALGDARHPHHFINHHFINLLALFQLLGVVCAFMLAKTIRQAKSQRLARRWQLQQNLGIYNKPTPLSPYSPPYVQLNDETKPRQATSNDDPHFTYLPNSPSVN